MQGKWERLRLRAGGYSGVGLRFGGFACGRLGEARGLGGHFQDGDFMHLRRLGI